ncbi:hypothetical protein P8918_13095 [Bacillus spizizenii]|nr:hypothetical protein [Bacillus spizizenii]MCY8890507.1 hypothetical protein [Bacillus spizizenii]MEC0841962.1 hypothetical protein [Bacillus spizizenii]
MANLEGIRKKFTVIKDEDLDTYLDDNDRNTFYHLVEDKIGYVKEQEGKKENIYLVINTDEPYADEVIEIMKKHDHWG